MLKGNKKQKVNVRKNLSFFKERKKHVFCCSGSFTGDVARLGDVQLHAWQWHRSRQRCTEEESLKCQMKTFSAIVSNVINWMFSVNCQNSDKDQLPTAFVILSSLFNYYCLFFSHPFRYRLMLIVLWDDSNVQTREIERECKLLCSVQTQLLSF